MAITPYLYYEDVGAALRFLAKAFGFRKDGTPMKGPDGKTSTAPVEGDALKALGSLKAGEDVSVTCRDNDQGEHQAVSAVKVVKKSGY